MNTKQLLNIGENALNICGVAVASIDLTNWLNIILLLLSIASILGRGGYHIYLKIKEKDVKGALDVLDNTHDKLENIIKPNKKENDNETHSNSEHGM